MKTILTRSQASEVINLMQLALLSDSDIENAMIYGNGQAVIDDRRNANNTLREKFNISLTTNYFGEVIEE